MELRGKTNVLFHAKHLSVDRPSIFGQNEVNDRPNK